MASQSLQIQEIKGLSLSPVAGGNNDIGILEIVVVQPCLVQTVKKVRQPAQESPSTPVALAPLW